MKKTRFLYALLMAIVMMAMSPAMAWAQDDGGDDSGWVEPEEPSPDQDPAGGPDECIHSDLQYTYAGGGMHSQICPGCRSNLGTNQCFDDDKDGKCDDCNASMSWQVASVTIGGNTTVYEDLTAAFAAADVANQTSTVVLLEDYTCSNDDEYFLKVENGTITLDLNGKTLAGNSKNTSVIYVNGGALTIEDGGTNGTVSGASNALEFASGALTVKGGTFNGSSCAMYAYNATGGSIILNGGKFVCGSSYSIFVPYVSGSGKWDVISMDGYFFEDNDKNVVVPPTNEPVIRKDLTVVPLTADNAGATVIIDGNLKYCASITDAVKVAAAGTAESPAVITLLSDYSKTFNYDGSYFIKISEGTMTIDLNGHALTGTKYSNGLYIDGANVTLEDNSEAKTGSISGSTQCLNYKSGSLTVKGGTYTGTTHSLRTNDAGADYTPGAVKLRGGTFVWPGDQLNAIIVYSSNSWDIFDMDGYAFFGEDGVEVEIPKSAVISQTVSVKSVTLPSADGAAASVKIGEQTLYYAAFTKALAAAAAGTDAAPATLTLLSDYSKTFNYDGDFFIKISAGTMTIDLNGHALTGTDYSKGLTIDGANVTLEDNSDAKTGSISGARYCLNYLSGSLTVNGGTYTGTTDCSLCTYYAKSNYTKGAIKLRGGTFVKADDCYYAVLIYNSNCWDIFDMDGYAFFGEDGVEVEIPKSDVIRQTVSVKPVSTVPTFASLEELIAANQSYDAVNVTIEEEVKIAMSIEGRYIVGLKNSEITLFAPGSDLGWASGGTVTGTLTNVAWNNTNKRLSGKDADFWSGLTYTVPSADNVPTFASIDELLAANIESVTTVTVTINGTIAEAKYISASSAYAVKLDNGFVLAGMFCVTSDPEWEVGGTVSGTLENVTFINENGEPGIMCMDRNIFAPGAGLDYTAPAGGSECEHDFTSKTLTAEPDENGLYAYVCDHDCGTKTAYNIVKYGDGKGQSFKKADDDGTGSINVGDGMTVTCGNTSFSTTMEFVASGDQVSVDRTFTAGTPATVMLPFSVQASEISGATVYEFKGVKYENGAWVADMTPVSGTLQPYKPYTVIPTAENISIAGTAFVTFIATPNASDMKTTDENGWTFNAVNTPKTWTAGDTELGKAYGFAGEAREVNGVSIAKGQFVKLAAGATAAPGRCYLVKDGALAANAKGMRHAAEVLPSSIKVRFINGEATGMATLNTETGELILEGWYDLNGRKINAPAKGGIYVKDGKKVLVK